MNASTARGTRLLLRNRSFVHPRALSHMVKDSYIADLIATVAMLDPILGGIDR